MQEKSKSGAQHEKMFLYYTMHWAKTQVSCVLLVFCMHFGCILLTFYQNANATHSVIWPLISTLCQKTGRFCLFLYEYFSIHIIIIS